MSTYYKVSLKVATYKLNDVISRLQGYDITVLPDKDLGYQNIVRPNEAEAAASAQRAHEAANRLKTLAKAKKQSLPSQFLSGENALPAPAPEQVPYSARSDYKRPPKRKRVQKVHRGLGWLIPKSDQLQTKAQQAILSRGVQPFRIADLIREAEALGSNKPAVYRAIWQEMADGNVVRVAPGRYQRTGQSFSTSLGFALAQNG